MKQYLALLAAFLLVPFALAATSLSVLPETSAATFNQNFTANVAINTSDSVYGAQFELLFNPLQLQAQAVIQGGFLSQGGDTLFDAGTRINNTEGKVYFAMTRFTFLTGVTGTGNLATVTFKPVTHNNASTLDIQNIVVGDPDGFPISVSSIKNGTVLTKTIVPIVINEIMSDPSAVTDANGEYFELYNPTNQDVDINGWTIKDNASNIHVINHAAPLLIKSLNFTVLCRNSNSAQNGNFVCDYQYSSFTLDNVDDEVILLNEGSYGVDAVAYNVIDFPSTPGKSMELGNTASDNSLGSNWREATAPFGLGDKGTPRSQNVVLTGPSIASIQVSPQPAYHTDDVTLSASISDLVPIINVTLIANFQGSMNEYQVTNVVGNTYSYLIDDSLLENKETIQYKWRAEDSEGFVTESSFQNFTIQNRAPLFIGPIPDLTWIEDIVGLINVSGYFTDPDGDNLTYYSDTPLHIDSFVQTDTGKVVLIPQGNFSGTETITFGAVDPYGINVTSNLVPLHVTNVNDAPIFTSIPSNLQTAEETPIVFHIGVFDVDNNTLTLTINDSAFTVSGFDVAFVPEQNFNGVKTVEMLLSDGQITISAFISITVTGNNDAPIIASIPTQNAVEEQLSSLNLTPFLSDPDTALSSLQITKNSQYVTVIGQTLQFNYPNGILSDSVTVNVSDGSLTAQRTFAVNVVNVNDAPVLAALSNQQAAESTQLSMQLSGTDEDPTNDTLSFSTNAPFGSLNVNSGLFTVIPTSSNIGAHLVNFTVTDNHGASDSQQVTITVTSALDLEPVSITVDSGSSQQVANNSIIAVKPQSTVDIAATLKNNANAALFGIDVNGTIQTTTILHDSESIAQLNGTQNTQVQLHFTMPALVEEGLYPFTLTAHGLTQLNEHRNVQETYYLNVTKNAHDVAIGNVLFNPDNVSCSRVTNAIVTLMNRGQFNESVDLHLTNAALGIDTHQNVTIEKNTQKNVTMPLNGNMNTSKGPYTINVEASYFFVESTSKTSVFTVANCNPNLAPFTSQINAVEEQQLTFQISATDIDLGDVLIYASNNSNISISKLNNNLAQVSWIPQNADIGTKNVAFSVSDGTGSDAEIATIVVQNVNDAPVIDTSSPASGNPKIAEDIGTTQTFTITKSDADNDPLTVQWFLNGNLVDSDDSYTYASDGTVGIFTVEVRVSDGIVTVSKQWTLTVTDKPVSSLFTYSYNGSINAATNLTIERHPYGKIEYGAQAIDISKLVDLDSVVLIQQGGAGIDSNNAKILNKSSHITLNQLPFAAMPPLYRNAAFSVSGNELCSGSICSNVAYNDSTKTLQFDVASFSVYFVALTNHNPEITSSAKATAFINEQYTYDVEATDSDNQLLSYSLSQKPTGMTIDGNNGVISYLPTALGIFPVAIQVMDGHGGVAVQSFTLSVVEPVRLAITDIESDVDGETNKNLEDGDKISDEAKPGSIVRFEIEVSNLFNDRTQDIEIQDIQVDVTIEGIDDGDDLEEEVDEFDIDAGDEETVDVEFRVPLEVDEDDYDVIIDVEGEDETGKKHTIQAKLTLQVEKEKHEIIFTKFSLSPTNVACSGSVLLNTELANIGTEDEDVTLRIANEALGIDATFANIEMEEGDDDDIKQSKSLTFYVNESVKPGIYPIGMQAQYDSHTADSKIEFLVQQCEKKLQSGADVKIEPKPIKKNETVSKDKAGQEAAVTQEVLDEDTFTLLLLIMLIVLAGLAVFIVGAALVMLLK